jgi:CelD/BcsL family acetyltransferase involved in cellulose biosynthesis/GNAT superfamily N-acetyltransferase
VSAWYTSYQAQWQPVIVRSVDRAGSLVGLWLLAYDSSARQLVNAGAHQAEYHAWLSAPGIDHAFLAAGWVLLKREFVFSTLRFKYLPSPALADILAAATGERAGVAGRHSMRPLLLLDAIQVKASAAKKSNKSRFNRLAKLGKFEFRRVTELAEFERIIDELIAFYDLRQSAVNQSTPFREDPDKRAFHSKLFADAPNAVYCTATFIDDRPIAAFWGTVSGKIVHLGLLISSPFYAEHSPGKIHIMQLSEQLLNDGHDVLDLTPGGDAWKERFANAHDEVAEATIYGSAMTRWREVSAARIAQWGKSALALARITPLQVRSTLATLRRAKPAAFVRKVSNWYCESREFRVYRADRALGRNFDFDPRVRCNHLPDLLAFEPGEPWQSRDGFLSNALARIEDGGKAFTVGTGGRLAHSGWMGLNQLTSHMSEVGQSITFPPKSVTLYDFYSHPDFRGAGLYRATIGHMLKEAFSDAATEYAYISVLAHNRPSRHVIETMGFEYQRSYFWENRFGKERKWAGADMNLPEVVSA